MNTFLSPESDWNIFDGFNNFLSCSEMSDIGHI